MNGKLQLLIIDDQFASDEIQRRSLLTQSGMIQISEFDAHPGEGEIGAYFCRGQIVKNNAVVNDYESIKVAVAMRWNVPDMESWSLVLLDVRFDSGLLVDGLVSGEANDDEFGLLVRKRLLEDFPALPIVILTSKHESEISDTGIPYLSKTPLTKEIIKLTLLRHGQLSLEQKRDLLGLSSESLIASPKMMALYIIAFSQAQSNNPIMILGETGTGKELLAEFIHNKSGRSGKLNKINMINVPDTLVESAFFGHMKGAFTGAIEKNGYFQNANGGTLFLDEIGETPLELQAKLLRSIQSGEVYKIGSTKYDRVDVRFICATHKDLPDLVNKGLFREDFYQRLKHVTLVIPPLRERRDEIAPLSQFLLKKAMDQAGKSGIILHESALQRLMEYDFPGNVRELESMMCRIVVEKGHNTLITATDLSPDLDISYTMTFPSRIGKEDVPLAVKKIEPETIPLISLSNLPDLLLQLKVSQNDPALKGIKPRLEQAMELLLRRCAGALLEQKKTVGGKYNRRQAIQMMFDDPTLKGKAPDRAINVLLGRKLSENVDDDVIAQLVTAWNDSVSRDN